MSTAAIEKGGKPGEKGPPHITVTVVYNGQPLQFSENPNEPVRALFQKALAKFGLGGDGSNLFIRMGNQQLSLDAKLKDVPVQEGATLYIEPRVVTGGAGQVSL